MTDSLQIISTNELEIGTDDQHIPLSPALMGGLIQEFVPIYRYCMLLLLILLFEIQQSKMKDTKAAQRADYTQLTTFCIWTLVLSLDCPVFTGMRFEQLLVSTSAYVAGSRALI